MMAVERKSFSPVYSAWFGKPVILLVVIRQCHVPMPCSIVSESVGDVRVRLERGWEMNVRKELILAVEEEAVAGIPARIEAAGLASIRPLQLRLSARQ